MADDSSNLQAEDILEIVGNVNHGNQWTEKSTIAPNINYEEDGSNLMRKSDWIAERDADDNDLDALHLGQNTYIGAIYKPDGTIEEVGEYRAAVGHNIAVNHRTNDVLSLLDLLFKSDSKVDGLPWKVAMDDVTGQRYVKIAVETKTLRNKSLLDTSVDTDLDDGFEADYL